ncbi:hypothetical protein QUN95_001725 [Vibrio parahaemolyticus]|nr:hypothetical protein [Vibrio parahaemolyticus]
MVENHKTLGVHIMSRQLERLSNLGLKTTQLSATADIRVTGDKLSQSDLAYGLSGLSAEAMAWASLAYVNSNDEKSLNMLVSRITKLLLRRYPKTPPKVLIGLVKVCFHEALINNRNLKNSEKTERKGLTTAAKARAMGINRSSFYKNKDRYDEIINAVVYVINRWECQIEENVKKRLSK